MNFKITAPFSAEIIVRKRFLKNSEGPDPSFSTPSSDSQIEDLETRIEALQQENFSISENPRVREYTIRLLEGRLEKIEANALKNFKEKNDLVKTLKTVIRKWKIFQIESEEIKNK